MNINTNILLEYLDFSLNPITALNLNNNLALTHLFCSSSLNSLDVTNNINLTFLSYSGNLATLDLTNNVLLDSLNVIGNQISILDLSSNTALFYVSCIYNSNLSSLDVSQNIGVNCQFMPINC